MVGNFSPKLGGQLVGKNQKNKGRVIFRAVEEDEGKATGYILKAIQTAADKLNARSAL
jgi:hypothetical protein